MRHDNLDALTHDMLLLMALSPATVHAAVACVHRCCPDDAPVMLDALGLDGGAMPVAGPLAYDGHVRFGRGK